MDDFRIEPIVMHSDARGSLYKVHPDAVAGEVYAVRTAPGCSRGHHFHLEMGEWFTAIEGQGVLVCVNPSTGERQHASLNGQRVYVPRGHAHAIFNQGKDDLVILAFAESAHNPNDVHPFPVSPP